MGERFANYEILGRLAAGGMAEVLLAKQQGLGGFERLVCLKRILPHLSGQEEFLKMFQDEARIAANLIHPNVAQIYDIGQSGEHYYIAMEYVRGQDLRRVYNQEVARGHSIPRHVAASIVMGAAAGLDYAHRQTALDGSPLGIVHRDISPQNILVTYDGHVKLIDFGVAKAAGKLNQTRAGVLKGKYSYMSPEQASGDPVDARTDIFALGTTLYEITTGTRLFKRDNELETLHAVIACNVPRPGEVVPGYDAELEAIVLKALAYDAADRYQTAGELERALEGFLRAHRHPTSASALADYMQALFADKLAQEALAANGAPAEGASSPSGRGARATGRTPATGVKTTDPGATRVEGMVPTVVGDDEKTTVDDATAVPPSEGRRASTKTPSEWQLDEARTSTEATGSAHVAPAPTEAVFLPTTEARAVQRAAEAAWPPEVPGADGSAAGTPGAAGAAPRPARRRAWRAVAGLLVVVGGTGLWWRHARRTQEAAAPVAPLAADAAPAADGNAAGTVGAPRPADRTPARADLAAGAVGPNEAAGQIPPLVATPPPRAIPRGQAGLDVLAPLPMAVTLGGRYLGDTPLFGVAVAPGELHLKLESREEGLTVWRRLRIGRNQARRVRLDEGRGQLLVEAAPWAWVQRGMHPAVETPQRDALVAGHYTVVMECPDGRRREQVAEVRPGETTRLQLDCR